jgi:hypothetical protein
MANGKSQKEKADEQGKVGRRAGVVADRGGGALRFREEAKRKSKGKWQKLKNTG